MPASLVLSVNNRYTGLLRVNIRYGKNGVEENFGTNGRLVLFTQGGR